MKREFPWVLLWFAFVWACAITALYFQSRG